MPSYVTALDHALSRRHMPTSMHPLCTMATMSLQVPLVQHSHCCTCMQPDHGITCCGCMVCSIVWRACFTHVSYVNTSRSAQCRRLRTYTTARRQLRTVSGGTHGDASRRTCSRPCRIRASTVRLTRSRVSAHGSGLIGCWQALLQAALTHEDGSITQSCIACFGR